MPVPCPATPGRGRGLQQYDRVSRVCHWRCGASFASRATIFSMTDLENLFAGFALGMFGSLLAWFWITRRYRPRFMVSTIARSFDPAAPSDIVYRIKVLNLSRKRGLTHLSIHCRVFIQGLPDEPEREETHSSFHIPVGDGKGVFPYIENGKGRIFGIHPENFIVGEEFCRSSSSADAQPGAFVRTTTSLHRGKRLCAHRGSSNRRLQRSSGVEAAKGHSQKDVRSRVGNHSWRVLNSSTVEIKPNDKYKETAEDEAPQPGDLNTNKAT